MTTDAMAVLAVVKLLGAKILGHDETKVPEPEFKPFRFPEEAAEVRSITSAGATREPRTLEELGVPGVLARELEATLRAMGSTRGDRVLGYTFRSTDGARHALRLSESTERESGLAA